MRISTLHGVFFVSLLCLFSFSRTQAREAYGYASINFDTASNTVTGYASTELDYETAAYYNAVVEAHIEDDNGIVLASGSREDYQSASVILGSADVIQCVIYRIISYLILDAIIFDDCGHVDVFGFGYLPFDTWWGWADFYNDRWLCRWERFIRVAQIIETIRECITATVVCGPSDLLVLPSGLSQGEMNSIANPPPSNATFSCNAFNSVTGEPVSNVLINFSANTNNIPTDRDGGHRNHIGIRPPGAFARSSVRTDASGQAQGVYTPSPFGGSSNIVITANGTTVTETPIFILVPGLEALGAGSANAGYRLTGSSEDGNTFHPNGHYATPRSNTALQQIAANYRDTFFPQNQYPDGVPFDQRLRFNDASLISGGKFDITPDFHNLQNPPSWRSGPRTPHDEHRVGINCDISDRNIPNDPVLFEGQVLNRWAVMETIFCRNGSTRTNREHCLNHWHMRFEFGQAGCHETEGCRRAALGESVPANDVAAAIPGLIEVESYDGDGEAAGSFVPDDGNGPPDDIYYNYPRVLPMPGDERASYVSTIGGQLMNYTVNIASAGSYSFTARVASPYSGNTFHIEIDGVDKTGPVYIPNTGSTDTYQFASVDNIPLDLGPHVLTLVVDGYLQPAGNFDYLTVSPYTPPDVCQPSSWELNECRSGGGRWDYSSCTCFYDCCYY